MSLAETSPNAAPTALVSVVLIVYNHANYLARALAGIEEQQLDGGIEVVIHDDCSTDGSTEICRAYAASSRHTVKLICQPQNKIGRKIGIWEEIYAQCTGEFIAICDGDDFWTFPQKLAHQCRALALLPNVDLVFHKTAGVEWQSEREVRYFGDYGDQPQLFPPSAVIEGDGGFIPTPSILFRRSVVASFPDWYYEHFPAGDYCMQVYAALRGGALYLPMCAAAYRQGDPQSWTQQTFSDIRRINQFDLDYVTVLYRLRASLPEIYAGNVDRLILSRFSMYCQRCYVHHALDAIGPMVALIAAHRHP